MTGLPRLFKRYGALALLLAAVCFYTVHYVPAVFFAGINSDELEVSVFYHDIFETGHSPSGWLVPGSTNLFPDWSVCFLLNFLLRSGLTAEATLLTLFFAAWVVLLFIGYALCGGKRPEVFFPLLVLLSVLFVRSNLSHIGAMLNTIASLVLTLFAARRLSSFRLGALAVTVFLGAASDPLFLIIFVCPVLAALLPAGLVHAAGRKTALRLFPTIVLGAGLGYLAAPGLFPVPSARASYTQFRPENILTCADGVWKDLSLSQHPYFVFLFALDLLVVIAGAVGVVRWRDFRRWPALVIFLFTYTVVLVAGNWAALLLTNSWASRYVYFSLVWPPLVAVGFLSESFTRRRWSAPLLALGVAVYTLLVALHPPAPNGAYVAALRRASALRALMAQEHMQAGFAEYWYANITTYLSGETVCLRPMAGTDFYHWYSNSQWIKGRDPAASPPKFRFILLTDLDPARLRARYGPPDRVARTSLDEEVWIYSEENAISYNRIFDELGNRHTHPFPNVARFAAASLPGATGRVQGTARVARAGRDGAGCLTFGPYVHVQPGRYQANYSYTYLKAPEPDKPATFDCVLRGAQENFLDAAPARYVDHAPQVLSRQIVVPPHPHEAVLEMRLHYFGSGDIQADALQITYLGP